MSHSSEKRATILRREGNTLHLSLDDGQELRWQHPELPQDLGPGGEVRMRLVTPATEAVEQQALAAAMVSELLRPSAERLTL